MMYIAIHTDAERKPKAIRSAARLKMQPREFIFRVMAPVWMFAAENNDGSGEVTGLDDEILTVITFGACSSVRGLIEDGWIVEDGATLVVPRWEEHEPYFSERARGRERKRQERHRKSSDVTGLSRDIPGKTMAEEKRVEESIKQQAQAPDLPDELRQYEKHVNDWMNYKRERREGYKPMGLKAAFGRMIKLGSALPAALEAAMANGWRGFDFPDRQQPKQPQGGAKPGW